MDDTPGWLKPLHQWEKLSHLDSKNTITYDAIIVLAGGLDDSGYPHPWVKKRLDKSIDIYHRNKRKCKIVCLGGGTYHKPPFCNTHGFVQHESSSCAEYMIDAGVPKDDIYREWGSYDTIGNGAFALVNFILPFEFKNVAVVTSDFHMERTKLIFNTMIGLTSHIHCDITYYSTPNMMDDNILKLREAREKSSTISFSKTTKMFKNISDFFKWFYESHSAYNNDFTISTIDEVTTCSY